MELIAQKNFNRLFCYPVAKVELKGLARPIPKMHSTTSADAEEISELSRPSNLRRKK
jgi:hypothetical protein